MGCIPIIIHSTLDTEMNFPSSLHATLVTARFRSCTMMVTRLASDGMRSIMVVIVMNALLRTMSSR